MTIPLFNLAPDLAVSRLCLGTMTFGEQNTLPQSFQLLDKAFDAGINFFDSAEMYPVPQRADTQGRSEEYLGRWIQSRNIPRDRLVLATKVSGPSGQMTWIRNGPHCLDARNITEAIDNSLLRLQTDYIDLYQIHWPDRYVPMFGETEYDPARSYSSVSIEEQLIALNKAIDDGKIRYIGLSNETPYGLMKFLHVAEGISKGSRVVSVQNSYNLLCRNFDLGMAECCHHERVILLAYSPLAMGILSGKYLSLDGGPAEARLNLFRGRYAEGESRYNLSNGVINKATELYFSIAMNYGIHPISLSIVLPVIRLSRSHDSIKEQEIQAKMQSKEEMTNDCSGRAEAKGLKTVSRSEKVGLQFPVDRMERLLERRPICHSGKLRSICLPCRVSIVFCCGAFVLRHPLVASAVFGATKLWQLQEVLNGCKVQLTQEIVAEIDKIHSRFPNPCP